MVPSMIPNHWPVPLALLIASLAVTLIVALRYMLASGLFAFITGRMRPGLYAGKATQMGKEIRWSLLSAAIYGVPAGIVLWGWRKLGWTEIALEWDTLPAWYWPVSVLIYLFVQDTCFYWSHRAMHRPRLFRLAHAVHHDSRPPTAWTAMSFHPIEAITGAIVVPVLVFFVPIHVSALGVVLTIATVMGVTNHMGWEMFPRWLVHSPLGHWLITASHHERHHEDYRCNFALYFRFWDHVCGTDRGLSRRIVEAAGHNLTPAPGTVPAE
jgi:sterol desaturase/sphingolipid hydroxylase (fatty acid hydroxylase superfamily)